MKDPQTQSTEITHMHSPAANPLFWDTFEFLAQLTACCGRIRKVMRYYPDWEEAALNRNCHATKAVSHLVCEYLAHISIPGNSKFRTASLVLRKTFVFLKGCLLEQAALDIHHCVKKW